MGEMNTKECLIYLDNIIISAESLDQHLNRLDSVFQSLKAHSLKLKASKCEFLQEQVAYIGHVVSNDGIKTDPVNVKLYLTGQYQSLLKTCKVS